MRRSLGPGVGMGRVVRVRVEFESGVGFVRRRARIVAILSCGGLVMGFARETDGV